MLGPGALVVLGLLPAYAAARRRKMRVGLWISNNDRMLFGNEKASDSNPLRPALAANDDSLQARNTWSWVTAHVAFWKLRAMFCHFSYVLLAFGFISMPPCKQCGHTHSCVRSRRRRYHMVSMAVDFFNALFSFTIYCPGWFFYRKNLTWGSAEFSVVTLHSLRLKFLGPLLWCDVHNASLSADLSLSFLLVPPRCPRHLPRLIVRRWLRTQNACRVMNGFVSSARSFVHQFLSSTRPSIR